MAEVFLARQHGPMNFEKVVVVKTIHPHLAAQKEFIDMLLDEARIAALLKHPCVVDIYDLGMEGDIYFIAMEYLSGQPLLSVLRAGRQHKKPLSIHSTCRIIADVADGLHAAHDLKDSTGRELDLVHRDITPGNLVVLYNGQVKIVDFGIAKARGRIAMETNARQLKGKLGYVAPEQIRGRAVDRRADIFALGVVLWESLTYRRLFRGNEPSAVLTDILKQKVTPPSAHRPEVPPELDEICLRALARNPADRYAEASQMQADLEMFLARSGAMLQKRAVADYMRDMFTNDIAAYERLLRETAASRRMIDATPWRRSAFEDESSTGGLPAGVLRRASTGDGIAGPVATAAGAPGSADALERVGDAAEPMAPAASRARTSAPDLRNSVNLEQQRTSYPVGQRPSTPDLERPSYPGMPRSSDPSLGRIVLPVGGAAAPVNARQAQLRRWSIGGAVGGAVILLLVLGLVQGSSEQPGQRQPASDRRSAVASRTAGEPAQQARAGEGEPARASAPEQMQAGEPARASAPEQMQAGEPAQAQAAGSVLPAGSPRAAMSAEPAGQPAAVSAEPAGQPAAVSAEPAGQPAAPPGAAIDPTPGPRSTPERAEAARAPSPPSAGAVRRQADTLYKEGLARFIRGDTAAARDKFLSVLRIRPGHAEAHRGLGMIYERTGQQAEAADAFRAYLRLAPNAKDRDAIHKRLSQLAE